MGSVDRASELNRRRFVVGAAAALCVGCSGAPQVGEAAARAELERLGGFGTEVDLGPVADVVDSIRAEGGFRYEAGARLWLTEFPAAALERARGVYSALELAGMEAGVVALYQKCPHLGCRVPECRPSGLFECPCHGSKFNRVGEKLDGPSPRGMDRFATRIDEDGNLIVDSGTIIQGPAIGVLTGGRDADGPNCIGEAEHDG